MSEPRGTIRALTAIETQDEAYEAAGAIFDALLTDGRMDDELGNYAELAPVEIARRGDGSIEIVVCAIRSGSSIVGAPDERVLINA